MLFRSPQYMDDVIRSNVALQNGPAVNNASGLAASHAAKQFADQTAIEQAGKRLALDKNMFDAKLAFQRDQMDYDKKQGNIATVLSAGGLGVSALNRMKAMDNLQKRMNAQNALISDLEKAGDSRSLMTAKYLKMLMPNS